MNSAETASHMLATFASASEYFDHTMERKNKLTDLEQERLGEVFAYIELNPEIVAQHTQSVDEAIANFNTEHPGYSFEDAKKNAKAVSRALVSGERRLPSLGELGIKPQDVQNFLILFTNRVERRHYGFIEHIPKNEQLMSNLVLAMIIDGYGLGARMYLREQGISVDDNVIVNAVCEEADHDLEADLLSIDWIQEAWGFAPEYEQKVKDRHPVL